MKITRFEELEVWQKARELAQIIYRLTRQGEFSRDYGLRDQMRRAAVSIMANVARPVK
jgi:four helix bundle protein